MFLGHHEILVLLIYSPKQSSHQVATVATSAATEESSEVGQCVMQICKFVPTHIHSHIYIYTSAYTYIILQLKFTVFFLWGVVMYYDTTPKQTNPSDGWNTWNDWLSSGPKGSRENCGHRGLTTFWLLFFLNFLKRAVWERVRWCLMGMMGTIVSWMVPNVFGSSWNPRVINIFTKAILPSGCYCGPPIRLLLWRHQQPPRNLLRWVSVLCKFVTTNTHTLTYIHLH